MFCRFFIDRPIFAGVMSIIITLTGGIAFFYVKTKNALTTIQMGLLNTAKVRSGALNYTFNEGPTWIAGQNAFFFSNFLQGMAMHGDIIKYTPGGACEIFITDVSRRLTMMRLQLGSPDGGMVAAAEVETNGSWYQPFA